MISNFSRLPRMYPFRFASSINYTSKQLIDMEERFGCHNYHPLPVVLDRGEGIHVWDLEGNKYMDFLAAYSAVNQGHCHPNILKALVSQASKLSLTSRAFHNSQLGLAEKYLAEHFKYDKVLFMNSGVEAAESAVKFSRRWAYNVKGVGENQARVLFANGNFWGRSIAACGSSDDPDRFYRFGPFNGLNFDLVDYNSVDQIQKALESSPNYAAVMLEPIQGERGVVIPSQDYLGKIKELCKKHKVLLVCDEIQTGLGRTGKWLASEWSNVRPDIVVLGKALSGGFYPVSALLADDEIMLQIKAGEHGSTYGGNPLACSIAIASLDVLKNEKLIENSFELGNFFLQGLKSIKSDMIKEVRGKGLMCAIEFNENLNRQTAWECCLRLKGKGILAKPTQQTTIRYYQKKLLENRFTPPLVITKQEIVKALEIISITIKDLEQNTQY